METEEVTNSGAPPESAPQWWGRRQRLLKRLSRFAELEAAGGIVLMVVAVMAMLWANISPEMYSLIWRTKVSLVVGGWGVEASLQAVINDGFMAIFFLSVGMEIKRGVVGGSLSTVRRAMLPVAAAAGGMIAPAIVYYLFNRTSPGVRGVAVPTATDLAFSLGVLTLLGSRVPAALRAFLLAFAVVDDLGAVLLISGFYSGTIHVLPLLVGVGGALVLGYLVRWLGFRSGWWYAIPLVVAWTGLHHAGFHPTLAGVLTGLLVPSKAWMAPQSVWQRVARIYVQYKNAGNVDHSAVAQTAERLQTLLLDKLLSPLTRIEKGVHAWVVFGILPVFALANAGVSLRGFDLGAQGAASTLVGVCLGLVVGKPVGIVLATSLVVKLGLATLPEELDRRGVLLAGIFGGVGFTMASFTAALAFLHPEHAGLLAAAKLGILAGSLVSGLLGYFLGPYLLPPLKQKHQTGASSLVPSTSHT